MKIDIKIVLSIILLVVLLGVIIVLMNNLYTLKKELSAKTLSLNNLNNSFNALEGEKENLEENYSSLRDETNALIQNVEDYQKEIQESLEWYKENSALGNSSEQGGVKVQVKFNCFEKSIDECRIKLGCFYLVNSEKLNLEYRYDISTYEREDKLSSIEDFLKNGGGDCEDYSLFFKAEYNYVLDQCSGKTILLEGWEYPDLEDHGERYWLNFQKSWYLEDVEKIEITEYIFPNIICGNLYDSISEEISGHCMIAFTKNKIESIEDLSSLEGAYIIEPQDGSFKGNINEENSGVYLLNKEILYDSTVKSWISSVITDNDYFLFSEESSEWMSYVSFEKLLQQKKEKIEQSIEKLFY